MNPFYFGLLALFVVVLPLIISWIKKLSIAEKVFFSALLVFFVLAGSAVAFVLNWGEYSNNVFFSMAFGAFCFVVLSFVKFLWMEFK